MKARARTVVETLILSSDTEDRPHEQRGDKSSRTKPPVTQTARQLSGDLLRFATEKLRNVEWGAWFGAAERAGRREGTHAPWHWDQLTGKTLSCHLLPPPPNTQHNKHRTAERRSDCGRCCGIPDRFRTTVSLSHQLIEKVVWSSKNPCRVVNVSELLSPEKIDLYVCCCRCMDPRIALKLPNRFWSNFHLTST